MSIEPRVTPPAERLTKKTPLPGYTLPLLAIWIALIVGAAIFGPRLTGAVRQDVSGVIGSDSEAASDLIEAAFAGQRDRLVLAVFRSDNLEVADPAYRREVETALGKLETAPGVTSVSSYYDGQDATLLGRDGKSTVALISVDARHEDIIDTTLPAMRALLADYQGDTSASPVEVYLTGEAAIAHDRRVAADDALARSERLGWPFVLITLVLIFGSLVAAGVPLVLGAVSVAFASAVVYFVARAITVDDLAPSMISMMGMGVGVDYSLFLVSRFREELGRGLDRASAMAKTLATSGRAIAFSGATVVVSVAGVFLVRTSMVRTLAMAVILVVVSAVLAALTFLPTLLLLLGDNVNRLRLPGSRRRAAAGRGFWHRWALGVMKRPWAYLFLSLVPLVVMALPVRGMKEGLAFLELVPPGAEAREGATILRDQFDAGLVSPIEVVVKVPNGTVVAEDNLKKLYDLAERLRADPGTARVVGLTSLDPDWTYEDYKAVFVDAPAKLASSSAGLGEGASGLGQSIAALDDIRDGLDSLRLRIEHDLGALGGAAGTGGATPGGAAPGGGAPGSAAPAGTVPGADQVETPDLAALSAGIREAASGVARVQGGLDIAKAATSQIAAAIGQVRNAVSQAKAGLEAMGPEAKTDPAYPATYAQVAGALAALDGIDPVTGQSSGSLVASLDRVAAGLGDSGTALVSIESGLNEAAAEIDAALAALANAGQGGADQGTGSGIAGATAMAQLTQALREGSAALGQMSQGLSQIIPALGELEAGLREASRESEGLDLAGALEAGDFPLRLAMAKGGPTAAESLADLVNLDGGSNVAVFKVISKAGPDDFVTRDLITRIRDDIAAEAAEAGLELHVGGLPAYVTDFNSELARALPVVIAVVLAITFLVLLVLLRSLLLPLKAVLMNILSVLASYGLLTLLFQHGHGAALLGFTPLGYVESPIILMLFAALFGLSMDYEVFLLTRIKESYDRSGDNEQAVAEGLEETAGIITGAAVIMIFVFGAFVWAGLIAMKEFGFGLAVAVALDATLIRIVLAPAFMRLMGEWNWWAPAWLKAILPKVGIGD